jgi:thiol:disulfide interchange protein DsbD
LIVPNLPGDAGKLKAPQFAADPAMLAGSGACRAVKATSTDPKVAEAEERTCHGVSWGMSLEQALAQAKAEKKPILIDFTGVNCANCRAMEEDVMPKPDVVALLNKFVTIQLFTDFAQIDTITATQREELGDKNKERLYNMTQDYTNPFYVVLNPQGQVLEKLNGFNEAPVFIGFLKRGLAKYQAASAVAQAERPTGR